MKIFQYFSFFQIFVFLPKFTLKNIGFWSIPKCKLRITKVCFYQKNIKHFFVERKSSNKLKHEVLALNLHRLTTFTALKVKMYRNGAIIEPISANGALSIDEHCADHNYIRTFLKLLQAMKNALRFSRPAGAFRRATTISRIRGVPP